MHQRKSVHSFEAEAPRLLVGNGHVEEQRDLPALYGEGKDLAERRPRLSASALLSFCALSELSCYLDCGRHPPPRGLKASRFSYTMLS
jgi:hypothetical protein